MMKHHYQSTVFVIVVSIVMVAASRPCYAVLGDQLAKLLADDGAEEDQFGRSVAIGGSTAIAGARRHDDNGSDSGAAYLFDAAGPGMCPWNLDDDVSVGILDLLTLLANWGPCP